MGCCCKKPWAFNNSDCESVFTGSRHDFSVLRRSDGKVIYEGDAALSEGPSHYGQFFSSSESRVAATVEIGSFSEKRVVYCWDSEGCILWNNAIGDDAYFTEYRSSIAIGLDHSVVVGLSFPDKMGIRKYDETGAIDWEWLLDIEGNTDIPSVAIDSIGNIYSWHRRKVYKHNKTGSMLWVKSIIPVTSVSPQGDLFNGDFRDINRYDTDGSLLWTSQLPADHYVSFETDSSVVVYSGGHVFVSTAKYITPGVYGYHVIKYDTSGTLVWISSANSNPISWIVDDNNSVFVCTTDRDSGWHENPAPSPSTTNVTCLDSGTGSTRWVKLIPSTNMKSIIVINNNPAVLFGV